MLQGQLANVILYGEIDGQDIQQPFWYFTTSPSGINLSSLVSGVAWTWVNRVMPLLSEHYLLDRAVGKALVKLQITTKGTEAAPEFRSIRQRWGEVQKQEANFTGITGGITGGHPMPSFVTYGIDRVLGTPYRIDPDTGVITGDAEPKFRDSSMGVSGMHEAATQQTEPNLLYAAIRGSMQAAIVAMRKITLTATMGAADVDVGKDIFMAVISKSSDKKPRIDKSAGSNPNDWTVQWVAAGVTNLIVNQEVSSKVSRKRKSKKLA